MVRELSENYERQRYDGTDQVQHRIFGMLQRVHSFLGGYHEVEKALVRMYRVMILSTLFLQVLYRFREVMIVVHFEVVSGS